MTMSRDQLRRNPHTALRILIIGACLYFLLCWPLYGRRGFPEKDPFWLAMIWLWPVPVFLSAIHDTWNRARARDLLLYALVVGFVVNWGTVFLIPSNKSIWDALLGLIFVGPIMAIAVLFLDAISQAILKMITFP